MIWNRRRESRNGSSKTGPEIPLTLGLEPDNAKVAINPRPGIDQIGDGRQFGVKEEDHAAKDQPAHHADAPCDAPDHAPDQ